MSRVLVTGGSGFIGTNLVQSCLLRGDTVLNLDPAPPRLPDLRNCWSAVNILDRKGLLAEIENFGPEYVLHLAARTDLSGKTLDDYRVNIEGTANVIAALRNLAVRRVLFASSMFVCSLGYIPSGPEDYCPHTVYGESKVAAERLIRKIGDTAWCWIIVRPTSIWGPWFDVPYKNFFSLVRRGLYFHPLGRIVRRSYGFVLNIVEQMLHLISPAVPDEAVQGHTFYLADYAPTDIREWAELIGRTFQSGGARQLPVGVLRLGAACGDLLKAAGMKNPPLTTFRLNNLLTEAVFDLSELRAVCGESPYSLEQGVSMTVDWMRRYDLDR